MKKDANISDELMLKFIQGELESDELHQFNEWIEQDEVHAQQLEDFKRVWHSSNSIADFEAIDLNRNWSAVQERISLQRETKTTNWKIYAAAAVVLLVISFWFVLKPGQVEMLDYTALEAGEELQLPDGSVVTLNKGAVLTYPEIFSERRREVTLKGEAFFDVAHNPERPFSVLTGNSVTKVLGTTFNINQTPSDEFRLSLYTGKVSFTNDKFNEVLIPGQEIVINAEGEFNKYTRAIDNAISWKTRKLVFDNTQMAKVVSDIEALYGVTIDITNAAFAECPITTTFDNESLDEVLETIQLLFDIEIEFNGQQYKLIGTGC